MAIFMDTGGGDIYAAETREQCIAAMREDVGEKEFARMEIEHDMFEVPGTTKMRVQHEDGSVDADETSTLDDEYTNLGYGYCIASENC